VPLPDRKSEIGERLAPPPWPPGIDHHASTVSGSSFHFHRSRVCGPHGRAERRLKLKPSAFMALPVRAMLRQCPSSPIAIRGDARKSHLATAVDDPVHQCPPACNGLSQSRRHAPAASLASRRLPARLGQQSFRTVLARYAFLQNGKGHGGGTIPCTLAVSSLGHSGKISRSLCQSGSDRSIKFFATDQIWRLLRPAQSAVRGIPSFPFASSR